MLLTVEPPPPNAPLEGSHSSRTLTSQASAGEAESGAGEATPTFTTSPQSQRMVKQARFTSLGPEAHVDAPFLTSSTSLPSPSIQPLPLTMRPPEEAPPSMLPRSSTSCDVPADHLKHLETLAYSMLATVAIIQAASTCPVILSPHARKALDLLNTLVAPPPVTTCPPPQPKRREPTKLSYAQATKGSHTTPPVEHNARLSPAGRKSPHSQTHLRSPQQPRHSAYRLIIQWPGHPVPQSVDSLQDFIDTFKKHITIPYRRNTCADLKLAGVHITKSGSVVIHTKAPHTASQLCEVIQLGYQLEVNLAGNNILGFICSDDIMPEVVLNIPWYGAVIHNVPAHPLLESYQGTEASEHLWDIVTMETGLTGKDIRDLRILCRDEDLDKRDRLSIRIMLEDPLLYEHFCCDDAFLFGTRCHISCYRPKKHRQRTPNSSS